MVSDSTASNSKVAGDHASENNQTALQVILVTPDGEVVIHDWRTRDPDVVRWARQQEGELTSQFTKVLRLGILASESLAVPATLSDVRRAFDEMSGQLRSYVDSLFGEQGQVHRTIREWFGPDGRLTTNLERYLGDEGELAAKLKEAVGADSDFERKLHQFIAPDGNLAHLLDEHLGEDGKLRREFEKYLGDRGRLEHSLDEVFSPEGKLGRELGKVFGPESGLAYRLLDPKKEDSPIGQLRKTLLDTLDVRKPESPYAILNQKLDKILNAVAAEEARAVEAEKGTKKGREFEDRVFEALQVIALQHQDAIQPTGEEGGPTGKKGDSVVTLSGTSHRVRPKVVFEVKSRGRLTFKGEGSIWRELEGARANRGAEYAVGIVTDKIRPSREAILQFSEPSKAIIAYVDEDDPQGPVLDAAYSLSRILSVREHTEGKRELRAENIVPSIDRISRSLELIRGIRRSVTTHMTGLKTFESEIQGKLESLQSEVEESLAAIRAQIK